MRIYVLGILMFLTGLSLVSIAIAVDYFWGGSPGYGWKQLVFLVTGPLLCLAGLRMMPFRDQKKWDGLILAVYFCGLIFMGIKPEEYGLDHSYEMLSIYQFSVFDFFVNIMGFMPIGYLMMSWVLAGRISGKREPLIQVTVCGLIVSFGLEAFQFYFVPSRVASIYDLLANGLGTFSGAVLFLCMRPFEVHVKEMNRAALRTSHRKRKLKKVVFKR